MLYNFTNFFLVKIYKGCSSSSLGPNQVHQLQLAQRRSTAGSVYIYNSREPILAYLHMHITKQKNPQTNFIFYYKISNTVKPSLLAPLLFYITLSLPFSQSLLFLYFPFTQNIQSLQNGSSPFSIFSVLFWVMFGNFVLGFSGSISYSFLSFVNELEEAP